MAGATLVYVLYGIIGPALEPFHGDHAWYTSFIYNYVVKGVEADTAFGGGAATGAFGGTRLFGKLFAVVSGSILDLAGWTPEAAGALLRLSTFLSACLFGITQRG